MVKKNGGGNKPQEYNIKDGRYGKGIHKKIKEIVKKRNRKKQDTHLEKWTEPPTFKEQMAEYLSVDIDTATKITTAISKWSDGVSKEIREAQYNSDIDSIFLNIRFCLKHILN